MPTTTIPSTAKAIAMARMFVPGQEIGRGEGHRDEQQQDDQDEPGLAHAAAGAAAAARMPAICARPFRKPDRHGSQLPPLDATALFSPNEARRMIVSSVIARPSPRR